MAIDRQLRAGKRRSLRLVAIELETTRPKVCQILHTLLIKLKSHRRKWLRYRLKLAYERSLCKRKKRETRRGCSSEASKVETVCTSQRKTKIDTDSVR